MNPARNTICVWYDRDAKGAAEFYAKTFPDSYANPDPAVAKRAFDAMMQMKKIDVAAIEAAVKG